MGSSGLSLCITMADQNEKSFQKQPPVFLNRKGGKAKKDQRYHRTVGLGFKTPREAIEGNYIKKYNRFEKRHKNMSVHLSPCFRDVGLGDVVTVGECRPLSKTVRFNVLKVNKAAGAKKSFKKF